MLGKLVCVLHTAFVQNDDQKPHPWKIASTSSAHQLCQHLWRMQQKGKTINVWNYCNFHASLLFRSRKDSGKRAKSREQAPRAATAEHATSSESSGTDSDTDHSDSEHHDSTVLFSASSNPKTADASRVAPAAGGKAAVHTSAAAAGSASERTPIDEFRDSMGIRVFGSSAPAPLQRFQELTSAGTPWLETVFKASGGVGQLSMEAPVAALKRNIEAGKWKEPMPVQMQTIPALLQGQDALASAPTGSGKTGAFCVPVILMAAAAKAGLKEFRARTASSALPKAPQPTYEQLAPHLPSEHLPRALVLAPTQELADQLARESSRLAAGTGVRVAALTRPRAMGAYGAWHPVEEGLGMDMGVGASAAAAAAAAAREEAAAAAASSSEDDADAGGKGGKKGGKGGRKGKTKSEMHAAYAQSRLPFADIIVSTPQRLRWVLEAAPAAAAHAMLSGLVSVVLDECDQLLLQRTFVAQVDAVLACLPKHSAAPGSSVGAMPTQRVLVSATMPSGVLELSVSLLRDALSIQIGRQHTTSLNVKQSLLFVGREEGKLLEMKQMSARGFAPPALVFVQSKDRVNDLVEELAAIFPAERVAGIHSSMPARKRTRAVDEFRAGRVWLLVTTELLGRGLDFKGVNMVINYDFPTTSVSYVHRVGRTGRGKRQGTAVTFFTESDIPSLRTIANVMRHSGCEVPAWMLQLKAPTRKQRKKAAAAPPKRKPISTTALYDRKVAAEERQAARDAAAAAANDATAPDSEDEGGWQPASAHNEGGASDDEGGWQPASAFNEADDEAASE